MAQPLIQLNGIARDFFDGRQLRRVLKKMDLSIYPGELTVLAGPSGSGKTTLLSIMGLLLKPSEGQIFIGDQEVSLSSENKRATMRMKYYGFVFQLAELIPALSVMENVLIAHSIQGKAASAALREKAFSLLSMFGLRDYARGRSKQLSSGQKQRVAIARALINDPLLLLCDEPTSALDTESSAIVLDTIKRISRDSTRGVVLVTHDPRVFPYADRLIKIEDGNIGYDSTSDLKEGTSA